jgi:hypothetical protein
VRAYVLGAALLLLWGAATARSRLLAAEALGAFAASAAVDQSNWSPERIKAYAATRGSTAPAPLAVLSVPRLSLTVPVLEAWIRGARSRRGPYPRDGEPGDRGERSVSQVTGTVSSEA